MCGIEGTRQVCGWSFHSFTDATCQSNETIVGNRSVLTHGPSNFIPVNSCHKRPSTLPCPGAHSAIKTALVGRICWILTRLWESQLISSNQKESHQKSRYLKAVKERISVNVLRIDSVFHLDLLKYHGLYAEHPATHPKKRVCCTLQ